MSDVHVEPLLIDHVRGDLEPAERTRVDAHLAMCGSCRAARERFAGLMADLAATAPAAPPIHWGAYRAELRERLDRRSARSAWAALARSAPALVAAALVTVLVVVGLPGGLRAPGGLDPLAPESSILASQLDMITRLDVVQQLDLLEDWNVIGELGELDELPEPRGS